jgi:hypothetical protein
MKFVKGILVVTAVLFTANFAFALEPIPKESGFSGRIGPGFGAVKYKGNTIAGINKINVDFVEETTKTLTGEAEILQSWQGDYPTAQLKLLPENQREQAVGFIDDTKVFAGVWNAFKPGEAVPEIDFTANLVLFARNSQFFNRISIGKVNITNGVAEVLAMETMSAMPIEDRVAMSLVVVSRKGITAIKTGDKIIPVNKEH